MTKVTGAPLGAWVALAVAWGSHAMIDLALRSIDRSGRDELACADAGRIFAGPGRRSKHGEVARIVTGSPRRQVVLQAGTVLTIVATEAVAMR